METNTLFDFCCYNYNNNDDEAKVFSVGQVGEGMGRSRDLIKLLDDNDFAVC